MNTPNEYTIPPGLLPLDAPNRKPGDPVVSRDGRKGRFIAYVPDASLNNRSVIKYDGEWCVRGASESGAYSTGHESANDAFIPDPDPVDPSPGNKDKLRRSQVGEGWRIPAHDEWIDSMAERWRVGLGGWAPSANARHGKPYNVGTTYRVPIAPPAPKTKVVPLTAADIPLGAWIKLDGKHKRVLVTGVDEQRELIGIPAYWSLASFYEQYPDATISVDGGDTWRPFTKEVPCE